MALRRLRRMEEEPHEVVLLRSPFSALERHGVVVVRHLGVDDVVGHAYSTSVASPQALGPRRGEFEAALRDGLARLSPSGTFDEIVEVTALIARRAP
jgi:hypothetical protein